MRTITEFLSTKVAKPSKIKATDDTIHQIVYDEIKRLGVNADLNHIDVSEVTTMYRHYSSYYEDGFEKSPFSNPKLNGYPKDGEDYEITKALNVDVSKWNVSNCQDFSFLFFECKNFNCDLSKWDTSSATSMSQMFTFCEKFNCDLSTWDVSRVKKMVGMFNQCLSFNFNTIVNWDVSMVTDPSWMFSHLGNLLETKNVDLSNLWFKHVFYPKVDAFNGTELDEDKRPFASTRDGKKHKIRLA